MKKFLYVLLLVVISVITVKAYTIDDFVKIVNDGEVTKEFIKLQEKEGCKTTISAAGNNTGLTVSYHFVCTEEKEENVNGKNEKVKKETYNLSGNIVFSLDNENIIKSSLDRTAKEEKEDPFYEKVLALTPYYGVEMSSKYKEISKYVKDNHKGKIIETFEGIFDKCYMEEMGVCYYKTKGMNADNYLGKVKLDDSGASYALKALKKEQREINTKKLSIRLGIFAVGLAVLIIILKSLVPSPTSKRCKY